MDIEKIKEDLSICYLKMISAVNGIALEEIRHDEDSTDVIIKKVVKVGGTVPFNSSLNVQLKATSSASQYTLNEDSVSYKLKVKNYNDLCMRSANPSMLALLVLPEDQNEWVNWTQEEVFLKGKMFWLSLQGKAPSGNSATVTVRIPFDNVLSTSSIESLLIKAAEEGCL